MAVRCLIRMCGNRYDNRFHNAFEKNILMTYHLNILVSNQLIALICIRIWQILQVLTPTHLKLVLRWNVLRILQNAFWNRLSYRCTHARTNQTIDQYCKWVYWLQIILSIRFVCLEATFLFAQKEKRIFWWNRIYNSEKVSVFFNFPRWTTTKQHGN